MRPFSDSNKDTRHRVTLTGDWWYFAGALKMLLSQRGIALASDGQEGEGWILTLSGWPQDTVLINGAESKTVIVITQRNPESNHLWEEVKKQLEDMAAHAREMRRECGIMTGYEVVEIYFRSRAAGSKVTLKQLAQQYGFNYKYLSNVKSTYEKQGGWGSKVHADIDQ